VNQISAYNALFLHTMHFEVHSMQVRSAYYEGQSAYYASRDSADLHSMHFCLRENCILCTSNMGMFIVCTFNLHSRQIDAVTSMQNHTTQQTKSTA